MGARKEDHIDDGRLYVTNVPYGATEEELRIHFESYGDVSSVSICKDEDTLKSRGFAFVVYVFPENAIRAQAELDLHPFQGRLLQVTPARERPARDVDASLEIALKARSRTSAFKKKQEVKKKAEAHLEHTWNLLFVSAGTAADVATKQIGVEKGDLFGRDAENPAVTAALTETSVIQQTKSWLQKEGVRVDAFERSGASLLKSRSKDEGRREDTLIVKHLPNDANLQELRERFGRYGELVKCILSPSGTVAIVQYADKSHAQHAFKKLAFARYHHVPLYLEMAPENVFNAPTETATKDTESEKQEDEEKENICSLFVKNLNFTTTDQILKTAFGSCRGLRAATVMRKKASISRETKDPSIGPSMGFGFLEFATAELAMECLKRKQGTVVEDHRLELQMSQRRKETSKCTSKATRAKTFGSEPRLCVRNLAFEATRKDVQQLFNSYGSVTSVRLPKRPDHTGHRGFAFVDFASKAEAAQAFETLQHTHLYGRHLVIEVAEEQQKDVESVAVAAQKRKLTRTVHGESKKRRRVAVLETSQGDFGEML